MARQNRARRPGAFRSPQDGPEVVGVRDPIEHDEEGRSPEARRAELLEGHLRDRRGEGHYPLGRVGSGEGCQAAGGHVLDPDVAAPGQGLDLVEPGRLVLAFGNEHTADGPTPGGEQLASRPPTLDLLAS